MSKEKVYKQPKDPKRTPIKRPKVLTDIKLETESASKLFKRHFKEVSMKVLHITQVLRRNGHYALAQEAQKVVEGWFATELEEIAAKTEAMNELKRQKHIDLNVVYNEDKPITVEVTSPMASRFLFLLEQLDVLIKTMETLWMGGALDDDQLSKGTYHWERRIRKVAHKTRDLSGRLKAVSTKEGSPEDLHKLAETSKILPKPSVVAADSDGVENGSVGDKSSPIQAAQ